MTAPALSAAIPGWELRDATIGDRLDRELLLRAYRFSERAHQGQKRVSGET